MVGRRLQRLSDEEEWEGMGRGSDDVGRAV